MLAIALPAFPSLDLYLLRNVLESEKRASSRCRIDILVYIEAGVPRLWNLENPGTASPIA